MRDPERAIGRQAAALLAALITLLSVAGCHVLAPPWPPRSRSDVRLSAPSQSVQPSHGQAAADSANHDQASLAQILALADDAWQKRDSRVWLGQSLELLERAWHLTPGQASTARKLSQAYFFSGARLLVDDADPRAAGEMYGRGMNLAQEALQQDATQVEASALQFWFAANLMEHAWAAGLVAAMRLHPAIVAALEQSLATDPSFAHGMAHSLLAAHLCRMPPGLGGDLNAAAKHFAAATAVAPNWFASKVLLAGDLATRLQQVEVFDTTLAEVLQADPRVLPDVEAEQRLAQRRAAHLQRSKSALFW